MAWPDSRLTTYGTDVPIQPNDLNAMQDATIAGKHGDIPLNIHPFASVRDANWAIGSGATLGDLGYIVATGAGGVVVPLKLEQGEVIKTMTFARFGDGVADFTSVKCFKITAAGVLSDITAAATSVLNPGAAWADTVVDITDTTVNAGDTFFFQFIGNGANLRIGSIRVTVNKP